MMKLKLFYFGEKIEHQRNLLDEKKYKAVYHQHTSDDLQAHHMALYDYQVG